MDARVKALGHPVHPMLVMFPGALHVTGTIFDAVGRTRDNETAVEVGYWTQTAGLAGGAMAATTGLIDWTGIPSRTRAKRIGAIHGLCNAAATALIGGTWLARSRRPSRRSSAGGFALQVVGVTLLGVSAWLGGELVHRLGIGVSEDAYPDAPSSLSTERSVLTGDSSARHSVEAR